MVSYLSSHFLTGFLTICIYICGNGFFPVFTPYFRICFRNVILTGNIWFSSLITYLKLSCWFCFTPLSHPSISLSSQSSVTSSAQLCPLSSSAGSPSAPSNLISPSSLWAPRCSWGSLPQDRSTLAARQTCPTNSSSSSCLSSSSGLNSSRSGMFSDVD